MVAFLGNMYGYTHPECMKLPIKLFFKLYEEARIMEARQYKELLLIQRTSFNDEFFKYMHERYLGLIYPEAKELPPKPMDAPTEAMDAGSDAVKNMLTSYAQKLRQVRGYGG